MAAVKRKIETMKELPEQVIRYEILIRLPVKSLVRFKSVCKYWQSLLSDPKFALEHYISCAMQNPNDNDRLVAHKPGTGLIIISRREKKCLLPLDYHNNIMKLIGSINGLLCLSYQHMLWLWNPAIHQSKEFTSPCPPMHEFSRNYCDNYGFGFDPVSNDYKVVVYRDSLHKMGSAFVYSSNSDTWTALDVLGYVFPTDYVAVTNTDQAYSRNTIVKDCPYWRSYYKHLSDLLVTVTTLKFETRSNEFKWLPDFQSTSVKSTLLVDMMDRPTFMDYKSFSLNIIVDLHSLDEGSGVWSKMYSVGPISSNIWQNRCLQGFKYGGELVFDRDGKFSYYDQEADTIVYTPCEFPHLEGSCYRYTPSLVFLEGMKLDKPLVQRHKSIRSVGSSYNLHVDYMSSYKRIGR